MRIHTVIIYFLFALFLYSCESTSETPKDYSDVTEIDLPTDSPRGLAFDGNFLWYSDDSLKCLFKVSYQGKIIDTISLENCHPTGFDFWDGQIWCINDSTVLRDTLISHYPFSCIYRLSLTGEILDSILLEGSVNPVKPEFPGLAVCDSSIYISTNQGWSSALYRIDPRTGKSTFLQYCNFIGLTARSDTLYGIDISYRDRCLIGPLDGDYALIYEKLIEPGYKVTDLAFIEDDLWVCDRDSKKLKRL